MLSKELQNEEKRANLIQNLETEEAENFMNEVGTLVFQSALTKYLAVASEEAVREFETFINLQVNSEKFFENLQNSFPEFGAFLEEEALALNEEMKTFVG